MQATADDLFRALADPTRRAIFERLAIEELPVHALTERAIGRLGDLRNTQEQRFGAYKAHELTDGAAHDLIVRALDTNVVPVTKTLLFREAGIAVPANSGNGFLIDNVSFASSNVSASAGGKDSCKHGGWKTFANPSFKNQGRCIKSMKHQDQHQSGNGHGKNGEQHGNASQGDDD